MHRETTAFDEFVRVHGDSLIRLAYVLCGDRGRAEDATQEALTRLYLRWARIDDPLPYARRCVVNADTILVQYGPPRGFKPTASVSWPTERIWLDAATYLPVRIKIFGTGTVRAQSEQTLAYLPATPGNLATFAVTPPAGFKQIPPPPFRGDGRPGLGQIPG